MICEVCKKNKAVVHFINIVNGKKNHQMLCEECALRINRVQSLGSNEFNDREKDINFNKILNGLFDYINSYDSEDNQNIKCENCGREYNEFKETGICGCSYCYKYFLNKFDFLEGKRHIGKVPKGKNNYIENKVKINDLREQLAVMINNEQYEEAAKIRDEIENINKELGRKDGENEEKF